MNSADKVARDKVRGYTEEDLAEIEDSPELTEADFEKATSFQQAFPELAASLRRTRGKQVAPTKVSVGIRLSADVVEHYRAIGRGWQTRIDEILRKAAGL